MKERIALVVSEYYGSIVSLLEEGARVRAEELEVEIVKRCRVSGALEIPPAIVRIDSMDEEQEIEGYVALGCVLRGETSHYEIISTESARGLMELGLGGIAVGNGILTCENESQAIVRADRNQKDKGGEAMQACVELIRII